MSSHREAPEISKDPVADSADLYAFTSYNDPSNVTIIANYVPLQLAMGGPNFYEFGDDVLYEIKIDNDGDGNPDVIYQFTFKTEVTNPNTFLYNTGPILSLTDKNWNRRQTYTVVRVDVKTGKKTTLGADLPSPPCNIGPLSTPSYQSLANAAINTLTGGGKVFAGQRAEGFYVDLGAIFDLAILRPFQQLHTTFGLQNTGLGSMAAGVNSTKSVNVHSIAIEVPKSDVAKGGATPTDATAAASVIGVWTTASRQKARVLKAGGTDVSSGPYVQVSRLGNPLVNEVVVPMSKKDYWNAQQPVDDKQFTPAVLNPELAQLLPALYPGVFPEPRRVQQGHAEARRSRRHLPHRHPDRRRARLPEQHGHRPGRHVAPQPGNPSDHLGCEQPRIDRKRSGRLSQRSAGLRRRHHDRIARGGRGDAAPGRQELHAGRRREPDHRRAHCGRHGHDRDGNRELPARFSVSRLSQQRIRHRGGVT